MFRIAVCDDDPIALQIAEQMLRRWVEESAFAADILTFDNGDALIAEYRSHRIDLIFLDILMPMLSGMDTARELRQIDQTVWLVFLTASPEFALESYEVRARGYLLKPVRYEKLTEQLEERMRTVEADPENLVLKTAFGFQKLYFRDIEYAEAQNKRVIFYLRTGQSIETNEPLHSFAETLTAENGFFKCHRSYLVYLPNVDHFNHTGIVTKSGQQIPIARGCAKAFKDAYFARMFRK